MGTVFMVMPFGDAIANSCYDHSTKPLIERRGLSIVRADEIFTNNVIYNDIETAIQHALVVIVDISGLNPNCLYELGMSHTVKRERTIMITHDEFDSVPFDISHFRIVQYSNTIEGKTKYEKSLSATFDAIFSGLSSIYADEFKVVLKTILSSDSVEFNHLFMLIAIQRIDRQVRISDKLQIKGKCKLIPAESIGMTLGLGWMARQFNTLGYLRIDKDYVSLTPKGQAFVEFLLTEGFEISEINGEPIELMDNRFYNNLRS